MSTEWAAKVLNEVQAEIQAAVDQDKQVAFIGIPNDLTQHEHTALKKYMRRFISELYRERPQLSRQILFDLSQE